MKLIISTVGILMIVATLLSLLPWSAWWVRDFEFPRVQIAAIASFVLLLYLWLYDGKPFDIVFIVLLLGCIGFQVYRIFPYTPLASWQVLPSIQPAKQNRFSLLVTNLLMDNRNATGLLDTIYGANADIVLTVETDAWWVQQLEALQEDYPFSVLYPLDNTYGMALYSRLPLREAAVKFLIQDDVPSIHTRFVLPGGVEAELRGLHPRPPSPTEHDRSTERDAELLVLAKAVENSAHPIVIAGDLNDVAWSRTTRLFQRISGLLDPRMGRGIYATFHARYPLLRWPLDHVFHSSHWRLVEMKTLSYFGSDHLPVFVTLSYEPKVAHHHDEPEPADQEDHQQAREVIKEAVRDN